MGKKNKKKNEPGPSGGGGGDAPGDGKPKPKPQQPPKQDTPKPDTDPSDQGGKGKKHAKGEQQHEGSAPQQPQQKSDQQQQQKGQKKQQQKGHQEQQSAPPQPGPSEIQQHVQQQQKPQQKTDQPQQQQQQKGKKKQQQHQTAPANVSGQQTQQKADQPRQQQPQAQQPQQSQQQFIPPNTWGQQGMPQQWGPQSPQRFPHPQQQPMPPMQQPGPWGPQSPQQQRMPQMPQQSAWGQQSPQQQRMPQMPQQSAWGQQPQFTPPQQQGMPQQSAHQQQQQRVPQQQQQRSPQQQQQQQQRGPQQQQQQQQRGPQQQQQQQQQQRGPQQQQQRGPQQPQQQQRGPQQQQRGPQQQQSGPRQQPQQGQPGQPGRPPYQQQGSSRESTPRIKESPSIQSISSAMSDISIKSSDSTSSHHGKRGRPIQMETNYVELQLSDKIKTGYHYDVTIDPDKPKRLLRLAFQVFAQTKFPKIQLAYDGRANCYSPQRLKEHIGKPIEITIEDVEFQIKKNFKVTLKETETCEVDMTSLKNYRNDRVFEKPMRAIQLVDVVLQQPCIEKARQGGRSYYKKPDKFIDLQDGYQLYLGLFQSMVLGDTPLLNIDVSHKAFPIGGSLIEYMKSMNFDTRNELGQWDVRRLAEYLKGLRLTYVPPKESIENGKDYTFNEVKKASYTETFEYNGQRMTIADYYGKIKQFQLRYPHLPCLWVGGKSKQVLLPIEFCSLREGQVTNKKAGTAQVRNMIKYAATSTVDRKQRIMDLYKYFSHDRHACVNAFGLRLGSEFITIDARIINAPDILYNNGKSVRVMRGSWNNQNMQFIQPVKDIKWAILYTDHSLKFELKKLVDQTKSTARSLNMVLADDHLEGLGKDDKSQKEFLQKCKQNDVSLVFVILNKNRDCYSKIKLLAETDIGILTQCIKGETLQRRMNQSTISNILLKVNTKLNGQNHKIEPRTEVPMLLDRKNVIMFVGADVTHPSPDQMKIPSVVGVVSSFNETFSQYSKTFRLQDPKQEMIQDMCMIMQEHLNFFKKQRGTLPNKIIYYRDGVSDGQFKDLKRIELNAMDQACAKMSPQYKPQITCIVVQKRHHTRFFPNRSDPAVSRDRYLNAPPGTVVDKKITHPKEFQFFLVSHESIQGTAKPTKYCVIRDDNKIDVDEMQAMTYNLCHMFARCNRAVSYPAPAYYAHLAAARGRVYIENNRYIDMRNLRKEYEKLMTRRDFFQLYPTFFI